MTVGRPRYSGRPFCNRFRWQNDSAKAFVFRLWIWDERRVSEGRRYIFKKHKNVPLVYCYRPHCWRYESRFLKNIPPVFIEQMQFSNGFRLEKQKKPPLYRERWRRRRYKTHFFKNIPPVTQKTGGTKHGFCKIYRPLPSKTNYKSTGSFRQPTSDRVFPPAGSCAGSFFVGLFCAIGQN